MPASPGGSVVDPSLLRQAADRGVTICFADLDGADGLWVPEERTVLVSRRLSESEVAAVIEHELTHVAIDDQHADLDAGRDVLLGHPPAPRSRLVPALLTGAALVSVVAGVSVGLAKATGGPVKQEQVVAPTPGGGLTPQESGVLVRPTTTVSASRGPDGTVVYVTLVVTQPPGSPSATPTPAATTAPAATRKATPPPAGTSKPAPPPSPTVSKSPVVSSNPPVTTSAAPPPTTEPPVTTPPASGEVDPGGDELPDGVDTGAAGASTDAVRPDGTDAAVDGTN